MKKYNLQVGIPISGLISVIVILLWLIRFESSKFGEYVYLLYYYFSFSLLCWIGNYSIAYRFSIKKSIYFRLFYYLVAISLGIILAFLYEIFNSHIKTTVFIMPVGEKFTSTSRTLLVLVRGGLINWLISFLVLHLEGMREKERAQLELEYLKQAHLQANLSSLKEQLSPHFLFNTLSALASLTKEQSVKDYIEELSSIYRYLLKHRESDLVTLKNEIAFCESYLYIIKTRLENAIEILIELTEDISNVQIPPLTLQLLIENAIKHNVAAHYKPLKIHIYVSSNSSLIVENNLQPKHSREKSSGIGLKNISQRYKVLLGQEITIEKTDTFFKIHLPLVL